MLVFAVGEKCVWQKIIQALPFLLFCGAGSGAAAFTLQMVSQKYLHPVTASLIMSLDSVFAVIGGWIFLGQILDFRENLGCIMIFIAIVLTQIPLKFKRQ